MLPIHTEMCDSCGRKIGPWSRRHAICNQVAQDAGQPESWAVAIVCQECWNDYVATLAATVDDMLDQAKRRVEEALWTK